MAGQIITFAAMARQMIAFAAMAGQMITFAAMAGQIITFASMPATNVWVVDDYQTRASISKISWRVGFIQNVMPPNILGPVRLGSPNRWISGPDDSDGKGEIYVECDSVVVCELLLGLRPWHLKSDYWYTIVCDCVGWCRCDEAGLVMMSLLVGRNRDKAICILAWQLTKVAAMAYVFCFSDGKNDTIDFDRGLSSYARLKMELEGINLGNIEDMILDMSHCFKLLDVILLMVFVGNGFEDYSRTLDWDNEKLFEHLPSFQQLLYRPMGCKETQPEDKEVAKRNKKKCLNLTIEPDVS
ncbi:hypothetical protein Tco_0016142 [Tanacetum coccineum]